MVDSLYALLPYHGRHPTFVCFPHLVTVVEGPCGNTRKKGERLSYKRSKKNQTLNAGWGICVTVSIVFPQ